MKTIFKVALFQLGDYLWGALYFLGFVGISLVTQYFLGIQGIENEIRVTTSAMVVVYAGVRSMRNFAGFQSWHLPRRHFFIANALALLAINVVSVVIGPALESVFGEVLSFEYVSPAEQWLSRGADARAQWAVLWNFNLHLFICFGMWLLMVLHYRQWLWKSLLFGSIISVVVHYMGISVIRLIGASPSFLFMGVVDGRANVPLAVTNLLLAALLCAGASYLALRRAPIR